MADMLMLKIIALDRILYEGKITQATMTTTAGDITILPNHMAIAAVLKDAPFILIDAKGEKHVVAIHGGYITMIENAFLVVADDAIFAEEIDEARVREDIRRNKEIIKDKKGSSLDITRAQIQLQRNIMNLKISDTFRK
ncbi:ATP synthase epsilon chain [Erysipelotrichaceae bacterium]|nr:ATP synthase epsilon chain [Erysipelotrichaceae bacterium]